VTSAARLRRGALVVASAVIGFGGVVSDSLATSPGRNGEVFLTQNMGRAAAYGEVTLVAVDPRRGKVRTAWHCESSAPAPIPECDVSTTPAVSPDGRTVAVISLEDAYSVRRFHWMLNLIDIAGGPTRVVDVPGDDYYYLNERGRTLRWVGDGTSLSVELVEGYRPSHLPVHRLLGLNGTLGPMVGLAEATSFDWTSDGRVAFIYRSNLFVLDPDGTRRRLTLRGADTPSWSPHGHWITFTRGEQIWKIGANGGRPTRLTSRGGIAPAWSPDGRQIAFLRFAQQPEAGNYLYVLGVGGGPARRASHRPVGDPDPYGANIFETSAPEWQALPR
jgi:dipeptidyl aminopeptidase/acylaminoacyl peptidase